MKTRINQILIFTLFGFLLLTLSVDAKGTEKRTALSHEATIESTMELNSTEMVKEYWEESMDIYFQEDSLFFEDWMTIGPKSNDKTANILGGTENQVKTNLWNYFTESIVLN